MDLIASLEFKKLQQIPVHKPAVYFLIKNKEVVYIGSSVNLYQRIPDHAETKDFDEVMYYEPKPRLPLKDTYSEMIEDEQMWIKLLRPKYNRQLPCPKCGLIKNACERNKKCS